MFDGYIGITTTTTTLTATKTTTGCFIQYHMQWQNVNDQWKYGTNILQYMQLNPTIIYVVNENGVLKVHHHKRRWRSHVSFFFLAFRSLCKTCLSHESKHVSNQTQPENVNNWCCKHTSPPQKKIQTIMSQVGSWQSSVCHQASQSINQSINNQSSRHFSLNRCYIFIQIYELVEEM